MRLHNNSNSSHNISLAVLASAATIGVVLTYLVTTKNNNGASQKSVKNNNDGSDDEDLLETREDDNDNNNNTMNYLPPHIQREIYKEERRKKSMEFLAMKRPMYDNLKMYSLSGKILCTLGQKKADWYIRKKIARWMDEDRTCIQLIFEPSGGTEEKDIHTITPKDNICVCCGNDEGYFMRHYVVPYSYRQLLPKHYKQHMSHDIVLLCADCNLACKQSTQQRQKDLENELRTDPETASPVLYSPATNKVKSCADALANHGDKIPERKKKEYEDIIKRYFDLNEDEALTQETMTKARNLEAHTNNPKYISGAELVVAALTNDELIAEFIRDWRRHFFEVSQPEYLPIGWSIDSPVHCDIRKTDRDD